MQIQGLSIVVTGAGSGIGAACARWFSEKGARVSLWDSSEAGLFHVARETDGLACLVDVTEESSVLNALEKTQEAIGTPRVLINCAGIAPGARILSRTGPQPLSEFSQVMMVNLVGTFNTLRLLSHAMTFLDPINEHGERGVIINTGSIAAFEGQVGQAAYAAAKGGVIALTLPAARELARFGIRVNTIAPGVFSTPMTQNMPQKIQETLNQHLIFPGRLGWPEEFAALAQHMVENVMINGTTIRLDGALRLPPK